MIPNPSQEKIKEMLDSPEKIEIFQSDIKKPVGVEAITLSELINYGIEHAESLTNGMPWSFKYKGFAITHETDEIYLIPCDRIGMVELTKEDMLVFEGGELAVYDKETFSKFYEEVK